MNLLEEFQDSTQCRVVNCKSTEYDIYIGRPSKWGNPFSHLSGDKTIAKYQVKTREESVAAYENWITKGDGQWLLSHLSELKGKRLGCWCKPKLCHGDILEKLVNKL